MLTFQYSLIRYMPNPLRGETINIGLVVYGKELDFRILKSSSKLRMLDNESSMNDLRRFESSFKSLYDFVGSSESLREVVQDTSKSVMLSELATFSITHASQYEAKVSNLFDLLVKPFATKERTPRNSRLVTSLRQKFASFDILAKDPSQLDEHKIVSNYVLNKTTGISVDFMLKNGKYHLTEVIDYDVVDKKAKYKETTMKLMTFVEGQKSLDGDVATYFVYSASSQAEKEVAQQINLAENYSTDIFNMASKDDKASYFQIIQDAIGQQLPLVH
ncbi:DUF3037 domain-containing protein [Vibrio alginolyticus]|uniref:DUF3037 domain-containing protein n=1 Tax=Vibrio alginolyticus TaxID=663 RepID=UPI001BD603A6|nr:DUF3037 domain-containing protein [Vibrio alginolyticus]MBS9988758.1 DUF3037 domain-containing protein [Vibrio alginolyticus]